jgi:hypothetical protein
MIQISIFMVVTILQNFHHPLMQLALKTQFLRGIMVYTFFFKIGDKFLWNISGTHYFI